VVIKQLLQMAHAAASIQELFGCIGWQSHFMLVLIQQTLNFGIHLEECQDLPMDSNVLVVVL
jgi:hypothetical protein